MSFHVRFQPAALEDLDDAYCYAAQRAPEASILWLSRFQTALQLPKRKSDRTDTPNRSGGNAVAIPGDTAAYPVAIQSRDGRIHIVYTSGVRTQINHAVFEESVILDFQK